MAKRIEKKDDSKRKENFRHNKRGYSKKVMSNKRTAERYAEAKIGSDRNDPKWYSDGAMAGAASNLFFTKRFGDIITDVLPDNYKTILNYSNPVTKNSIPGIMKLDTVTAFGEYKNNEGSPINIAAQAMYSYVRYANSGSRNYDSPDLMTYVLALEELYSFIVFCQRTYGYLNTYYPQNSYFANDLISMMGFNFSNLIGNTAQFCFYINTLIAKATAFALPADFWYTQRKVFMYQNVFIESDNIKDQMYFFNPTGFYKYTVDSGHPEAYLKYVALPSSITLTSLMAYGDSLVQALLNNEDAGIISGDIIKAYGTDKLVKLAEMPLTYALTPVVGDDNIMYQIRNATIVPCYNYPDIYQDATKLFLEFHPEMRTTANAWYDSDDAARMFLTCGGKLLTSNKVDPTSDDVMESTRLMVQTKNPAADGSDLKVDLVTGSEIVVNVSCMEHRQPESGAPFTVWNNLNTNVVSVNAGGYSQLRMLSAFRYHPTVFIANTNPSSSSCIIDGIMQECETITTVDYDELSSIHQAAWLNMLAVPAIAKLR